MRKQMSKRIMAVVLTAVLSLGGLVVPGEFSQAESSVAESAACQAFGIVTAKAETVNVTGKYYQSDARKMLKKINKFRTGSNAWCWNESDTEKVKLTGLKKLNYDYKLEKVAMKRAAELALSFSHTRPNGQSCFSAYPDGYMWKGENIACGSAGMVSMAFAFEMWQETNQSYAGQGHRRNMLNKNFTSVGVACFEYKGMKYWVQEFASPTPKKAKKKTKAVNGKKTVKISR